MFYSQNREKVSIKSIILSAFALHNPYITLLHISLCLLFNPPIPYILPMGQQMLPQCVPVTTTIICGSTLWFAFCCGTF